MFRTKQKNKKETPHVRAHGYIQKKMEKRKKENSRNMVGDVWRKGKTQHVHIKNMSHTCTGWWTLCMYFLSKSQAQSLHTYSKNTPHRELN